MRITDLRETKRGRMAVDVDGDFCFALHPEVFAACGWRVGDEVEPDELAGAQYQSEVRMCKDKALRLLSGQDYTRRQLLERLCRTQDSSAAEEAVERMAELGLVDDYQYAMRCARDLVHLRAFSPRRVEQELRRRGVDEEIIEEAIAQFEEDDPCEAIAAFLRRRHPAVLLGEADERARRRAVAALQRLGYAYGDIRHVLENPDEYEE